MRPSRKQYGWSACNHTPRQTDKQTDRGALADSTSTCCRYFQRKLERKKRKRDDDEQLDFDDLRDSVEFGEVADRPPELPQLPAKLKAVPKKPSAASTLPRSMTQKADEVMLKYKQRAADGSGLSGRVLDIERAKAIGNYRVAKKRKRLASTDVSLGDE